MRRRFSSTMALTAAVMSLLAVCAAAQDAEQVGKRPYEMDWAGRTEEVRAPLVDFEELDGWRVEVRNATARFERSREEQMYGSYVGKLTYRCDDPAGATPIIDIRPPEPVPFSEKNVDAYSLWAVGNNWGWTTDPTTPRVRLILLLADSEGKEGEYPLETVDWKTWFLCYRTIAPERLAALSDGGAFTGIRVVGGTNTEDRTLYFDSLCVFKEERAPLTFSQRPRPGIDLFEGQPLGVNTGEGRLPFPTNEDTVVPDSSKNLWKPAFHFYGDGCDFVYEGTDGTLVYEYRPRNGDWSDLTARWNRSEPIQPCVGGGVTRLVGTSGDVEPVTDAALEKFESTDDGARAVWTLRSATASAQVEYRFQIKGKSLVVDTIALGGRVPEVTFGRVENIGDARVFTIPYYLYDYSQRPGVAIVTTKDADPERTARLFASAHVDWYRSGASYLRGRHGADAKSATLNGGAEYRVKTDGARNDVYERFVVTFSPAFEEVLPTLANPASPYRDVAGKGVWRSHGATTRDNDRRFWNEVRRRGMRHIIVTDHEVCWRDGGESFTFRTKPAPEKGGDQGWFDYSRFMQDELGFVYGPYNNFTDFAPVNEYWSPDMVNRGADWSLQRAWMRCYAPKPIRAVEFCEKLTPIIEDKFHFSCAYCDVHSSVPPWTRTDYDERVPGAGTFMSVYYPYGEIFLLQKKFWDGPTYSEGPHHCFYAGLTDGNYAQDQPYNMFLNPWLVDFDLLKIHELEVDFGMGNLSMFAPGYEPSTPEEKSALLDRFLAATLAFGHSGFLAMEYGWDKTARSYFMTQQIASYYTQASAKEIRYYDVDGTGYDTTEALKRDLVRRSQLSVVYSDGTTVVANGATSEGMRVDVGGRHIELPPNGYAAWTADGKVFVKSALSEIGRRVDYCESPEYIWFDGRDSWAQCARACGYGAAACLALDEAGEYEIIPFTLGDVGFRLADAGEDATAVALDFENRELGAARVRRSNGFLFVEPVDGAFSYRVTVKPLPEGQTALEWRASKDVVALKESVVFSKGDATVETMGFGESADDVYVAFTRRPFGLDAAPYWLADVPALRFRWTAPTPGDPTFILVKSPWSRAFRIDESGALVSRDVFKPDAAPEPIALSPEVPEKPGAETQRVVLDGREYTLEFNVVETYRRVPFDFENPQPAMRAYIQRRGAEPSMNFEGTGAQNFVENVMCGGVVKKARRMHPPYLNGAGGRTYVEYDVTLPEEERVALRASVGKGDGSDVGDGILYQLAIRRPGEEKETVVAQRLVTEHEWTPIEADLSKYAGERVTIMLIADMNENSSGDWACLAEPRLESVEPYLRRDLVNVTGAMAKR